MIVAGINLPAAILALLGAMRERRRSEHQGGSQSEQLLHDHLLCQ